MNTFKSINSIDMIIKFLDILRISMVSGAFFFGYLIGLTNGYHPVPKLHFMIP